VRYQKVPDLSIVEHPFSDVKSRKRMFCAIIRRPFLLCSETVVSPFYMNTCSHSTTEGDGGQCQSTDQVCRNSASSQRLVCLSKKAWLPMCTSGDVREDTSTCRVNSYPRLEAGGLLHLASTAILSSSPGRRLKGRQLWLHRPMHQGPLTKGPSFSSLPEEERCSTASVLPRRGLLAWNPATQLSRNAEANRLSSPKRSA
jgi:hypothetical protein